MVPLIGVVGVVHRCRPEIDGHAVPATPTRCPPGAFVCSTAMGKRGNSGPRRRQDRHGMQAASMRVSGAGQKIELPSGGLGDSIGAHAGRSGGLTHFVPAGTGGARDVGVPAAEAGSAANQPDLGQAPERPARMPVWCSGGARMFRTEPVLPQLFQHHGDFTPGHEPYRCRKCQPCSSGGVLVFSWRRAGRSGSSVNERRSACVGAAAIASETRRPWRRSSRSLPRTLHPGWSKTYQS